MMQATFHHGPATPEPLEDYCCELVCRLHRGGGKVLVLARDAEQLKRLDEMLWALADSFVPHGELGDETAPPVVLTCAEQLPPGGNFATLVVAPGASAPDYMGRFEHMHYLVLANSGEEQQAARQTALMLHDKGLEPRILKVANP